MISAHRRLRVLLFFFVCLPLLAASAGQSASASSTESTPAQPRLLVLVVFDQMRADYQERWQDLFVAGGFRRLQTEGAWFQNCRYPYAYTFTGPGHASMSTGLSPDRHGIINNEWYDRAAHAVVGCVESVAQAGPPSGGRAKSASPERLLSAAFADRLKEAHADSRVVSVSIKDRAAVLLGGHRADVCCWMDENTGSFVTSGYYRAGLPNWVTEFNSRHPADRWVGRSWEHLLPQLDYARRSGPDDVKGEGTGKEQGRTFPHPFSHATKPSRAYYQALYASPFENDLLLDLAKRAIDAEHLGQHDTPDALCVSFSCTDSVGHVWGPDSQEVLDVTLRADRVVKDLLDYLDLRVGRGRYLLAFSADHGVCPLPDVSRAAGRDAGLVDPRLLATRAETFLGETFGKASGAARWLEGGADAEPWLYLNRKLAKERALAPAKVEQALADWLVKQTGIRAAYTRTQLLGNLPQGDEIGRMVQRSFYPSRSGDVGIVLKPYYILWSALPGTGTTHGSPYDYDTHVPLFIFGARVAVGVRKQPVMPQSVSAIFLHAIGLAAATGTEDVPDGLWAN